MAILWARIDGNTECWKDQRTGKIRPEDGPRARAKGHLAVAGFRFRGSTRRHVTSARPNFGQAAAQNAFDSSQLSFLPSPWPSQTHLRRRVRRTTSKMQPSHVQRGLLSHQTALLLPRIYSWLHMTQRDCILWPRLATS